MKRSFITLFGILSVLTACEKLDTHEPGALVPKTVDQDAHLPSIAVNHTQLHSEAFGNSTDPMVVVLHGGPGGDYRALMNCKELVNHGYYVIFYDQRGSGLSKREGKGTYSVQLILNDLSEVIRYYRSSPDQQVILLGHSWGAMLASAYINAYPDAIDGAILCEPGGLVWSDIKSYTKRVMNYSVTSETLNDATYLDQFITGKATEHELLDYKFGLYAGSGTKDSPLGDEDEIPFWRKGAIVNQVFMEIGEREKPDWTTNLDLFNEKILFIYSERNKAYGADYAQHVSSAYLQAQLYEVKGAGHEMLSFRTGWDNFLPKALEYLNEIK